MSTIVLDVNGMAGGYRGIEVVRDVSFQVRAGEVVTLLGANGAGKSTTLMTIARVLKPIRGSVEVLGESAHRRSTSGLARRGMVLVPEDRGLFGQLSVADNLRIAQRSRVSQTDDVIGLLPALGPLWRRKVGLLSGGEQQMLALAAALVRRPRLLMLDEMSLGLAPQIVTELLAAVRRIADQDGTGVLLVEQHAQVALGISDSAMVLRRGELAAAGSVAEINAHLTSAESGYLA